MLSHHVRYWKTPQNWTWTCSFELRNISFVAPDLLCACPVYYTWLLSQFECFTEILCCILPVSQILHTDADHTEEALSSLLVTMADAQVDRVSHWANPQCHSQILRSCRLHMTPLTHCWANIPPTRSTFLQPAIVLTFLHGFLNLYDSMHCWIKIT